MLGSDGAQYFVIGLRLSISREIGREKHPAHPVYVLYVITIVRMDIDRGSRWRIYNTIISVRKIPYGNLYEKGFRRRKIFG